MCICLYHGFLPEGSLFNSVYLKFYFVLSVTGPEIHSELHSFVLFLMTTLFPWSDTLMAALLFYSTVRSSYVYSQVQASV
jgi:hypothetical protein